MHQRQIDGVVVMGTGHATTAEVKIGVAMVVATYFGENKIPTIKDISLLKTVVLENPVVTARSAP